MKIRMFRNLKCPDRRIRTICDLLRITVFHPLHGQFHIRLPGTDPHVPDQNILYDRLVSGIIPDIHRVRTARLRFLHPYFPNPFPISKGNIFLPQESDHYLSPRLVKSPDTHPLFLLQHHTVTDQSWQLPFTHSYDHAPFSPYKFVLSGTIFYKDTVNDIRNFVYHKYRASACKILFIF